MANGCGTADHDIDCLCDVEVGKPTPITHVKHVRGNTAEEILGWMERTREGLVAFEGLTETVDKILELAERTRTLMCSQGLTMRGQVTVSRNVAALIAAGLEVGAVGRLLEISEPAVGAALCRGRVDGSRVALVVSLLKSGSLTVGAIATASGVSKRGVYAIGRRIGIEPHDPKDAIRPMQERARELSARGMKQADVWRALQAEYGDAAPTRQAVGNWVRAAA